MVRFLNNKPIWNFIKEKKHLVLASGRWEYTPGTWYKLESLQFDFGSVTPRLGAFPGPINCLCYFLSRRLATQTFRIRKSSCALPRSKTQNYLAVATEYGRRSNIFLPSFTVSLLQRFRILISVTSVTQRAFNVDLWKLGGVLNILPTLCIVFWIENYWRCGVSFVSVISCLVYYIIII